MPEMTCEVTGEIITCEHQSLEDMPKEEQDYFLWAYDDEKD